MPDIFGVIELVFFAAAFVFAFMAVFRSSTPVKHKPQDFAPQAGDQQTGDQQTGDQQTGDQQTGDQQTGDRRRWLFALAAAASFAVACSPALFLHGRPDPSLPPMPPPGERQILDNGAFWTWLAASMIYWAALLRQWKKKPVQTVPQAHDFRFRLRTGLLVLLLAYIAAVQVIKHILLPPPAPTQRG